MAEQVAKRRALAERHVVEGGRVVERQRKLVAALERRGINSSDARALLAQFERTLLVFEDDLESIMKQDK